jgi:hypothetical protein
MIGVSRNGYSPWLRNSGLNAPNWNQRKYSSRHSGSASGSSFEYRSSTANPPMSWVQLGTPEIDRLAPALIWSRKSSHRAATSPDHSAAEARWMPPKPLRVRMNGRRSGCAARRPSAMPSAWTSGYELKIAAPGTPVTGEVIWKARSSIDRFECQSGSVASIHHASKPLATSASLICRK